MCLSGEASTEQKCQKHQVEPRPVCASSQEWAGMIKPVRDDSPREVSQRDSHMWLSQFTIRLYSLENQWTSQDTLHTQGGMVSCCCLRSTWKSSPHHVSRWSQFVRPLWRKPQKRRGCIESGFCDSGRRLPWVNMRNRHRKEEPISKGLGSLLLELCTS